jgi:hypothetical protein
MNQMQTLAKASEKVSGARPINNTRQGKICAYPTDKEK